MRKMKLFVAVAAVALLAVSAVSCGGGKGTTPSDITTSLLKALKAGDADKITNVWFDNSVIEPGKEKESKEMIKAFAEKALSEHTKKGGLKDFSVVGEEIAEDGNSAEVKFHLIFGDGSEEDESNNFKKIDGAWKFDNDK